MTSADVRHGGREGAGQRLSALLVTLSARRWFWPVVLLLGYAAQVAFRLSLVMHNSYPSVHADEDSYLVIARVLAGRPTTEMPVGVVIPGGYPLLLTPALWFADNPTTAYHLVMGINSLVNALVFPLAFVALRRLGVSRTVSVAMASAAALMPPVIFYSEFAMSDTVFPVILLAWLITMHGWLSEGSFRRRSLYGAAMGLSAGYALATHDRGGVVMALTALTVLIVFAFGWAPRWSSVIAAAVLGAAFLGSKLLAAFVESQFKDSPPSSVGTQVMENLFRSDLRGVILTRTLGQVWYFVTSSWGFGAVALLLCLFALFSGRVPRASRIVAFCMTAALVGIALASAAGLAEDPRVDNWIYARYLAPLVPAFFVVGAAALHRLRTSDLLKLAITGAVFALVSAKVVIWYAGKALTGQDVLPWGMPDALFLASEWTSLNMGRTVAGAFLVLGMCLLLLFAGGRRVLWALAVCLAVFAMYATATISDNIAERHSAERANVATGFTRAAGIVKGDNVVLDWDLDWGLRMAQTYEVYWGRVWTSSLKSGSVAPPTATVAVIKLPSGDVKPESTWPGAPADWHVSKVSVKDGWVVWRRS